MSKSLSSSQIELLNKMSKLCDRGLSPKEAAEWMLTCEPEWTCGSGYTATKGNIMKMKRRIEKKLEMMKQVDNGVTVFVNGKPQRRS